MLPSRGVSLRMGRCVRVRPRAGAQNLSYLAQRPSAAVGTGQHVRTSHLLEQRRHISFDLSSIWSSTKNIPESAAREGLGSAAATTAPVPISSTTQATVSPPVPASPGATTATAPPHLDPSHAEHALALPRDVDPSPITDMNLDAISAHHEGIVERVGYLHQLGIDYGWGPTSCIQWLLENIHFVVGLPWWASLVGTAAIIRLSIFPLNMRVSDMSARLNHIRPMITPLTERMTAAIKAQDVVTAAAARHEMTALQSRAGIRYGPTVAGLVLNGVFGFCGFRLMNSLAALPVPSMMDGGALWFTDLTISDPYYLLPSLMGFALHLTFRFAGGDGGVNTMDQYKDKPGVQKFMQYGLPALVTFSMIWFSAGTNLYIATNTLIGLSTGRLLLNPAFRERFDLTPNPQRSAAGTISNPIFGAVGDFASAANKPSPTGVGEVIDVQNVNRVAAPSRSHTVTPEYQAPRATPSPGPAAGLGDRLRERSGANKGEDAGVLDRYVSWGADKINSLGSGYTKASEAVSGVFGGGARKAEETEERRRAERIDRQRVVHARRGRSNTGRR